MVITTLIISIVLLSGCIKNVPQNIPKTIEKELKNTKTIAVEEFGELVEISSNELSSIKENILSSIDDIRINDDKLIRSVSLLDPIDIEIISGLKQYHEIADYINLIIDILNREIGFDFDKLQGTQNEYKKLSKILTEYSPLIGNYNKMVNAANDYSDGKSGSKNDFYMATGEFALELILIQGAVFYKPSYRVTGFIYRNSGLNRLAFNYPSVISFLLSNIHWYLRALMVNKSSEIASFFVNEFSILEKMYIDI